MRKRCLFAFLLVILLTLGSVPFAFAQPMTLAVDPDSIGVGLNFNGGRVDISGQAPENSQVFLKIVSRERPVGLSKKGKKSGLWMTVETVTVKGMPAMYKVLGSGKVDDLPKELKKQMGIDSDYTFIRAGAQVLAKHDDKIAALPPEETGEYLAGLVRLNSRRGLYEVLDNVVQVEGNRYQAGLNIPADVPRGQTEIFAYAVRNGQIVATAGSRLSVVNGGLVRTLSGLAQTNAVVYGAFCIFVALLAGIVISGLFGLINKYIFKDEKISAHH